MSKINASVPDPVEDALERVADVEDKSFSRVVSERLERQLRSEGYLDHLDEEIKDSLEAE